MMPTLCTLVEKSMKIKWKKTYLDLIFGQIYWKKRPKQEAASTLHQPKNDILAFFKFMQKNVYWLDKKAPALFCIFLVVVICKIHMAKPLDSFNKCRKIIL